MIRSVMALSMGILALALTASTVQAQKTTTGIVKSVADASITIQASGGDKASHTFSVDAQTEVVARGATQATKGRGRGPISSMIGVGDTVTITTDAAKADRASTVKLDRKAK